MGKPSSTSATPRRLRAFGLSRSRGLLLGCAVLGLVGSVALYGTAAAALVGQSTTQEFGGMLADAPFARAAAGSADGVASVVGENDGEGESHPLPQTQGDRTSVGQDASGVVGEERAPSNGELPHADPASPSFPAVSSNGQGASTDAATASKAKNDASAKETGSDTAKGKGSAAGNTTSSSSQDASSSSGSGAGASSSSSQGASSSSSSSSSKLPSNPTAGSEPSEPSSSADDAASDGLSEATEKKIHAQLTSKYEGLAPLAKEVGDAVAVFDAEVDDASASTCKSMLSKIKKLHAKAFEASDAMRSLAVPTKSRYHNTYKDMLTLYDDLVEASDVLRRAWAVACGSTDASGASDPRQVVRGASDKDGKLKALKDYENRYPGARP